MCSLPLSEGVSLNDNLWFEPCCFSRVLPTGAAVGGGVSLRKQALPLVGTSLCQGRDLRQSGRGRFGRV